MGLRAPPELGELGDLEYGEAECCRVGWNWPVACIATVVAPFDGWPAFVTMLRLFEEVAEVFTVLVVVFGDAWA